jgi:TP901 family phage tail tape measure protein
MARFAVEANNAAKKLSTTTTDYTNASLIYFQQGLSDKEVAERTEVTIKMANAAGVSAQKVSDQMTAVWNNFDDGSKSLEYYADVMTALGAATASSTDEISQGLQKFAAVAETVGLSYEYATAALATVTAETRESADVVGTAYKTLFARIQGLQQGDTLDDGTSLNKYSAALAKVGIDIKDVNGDMKDMDVILNEMGAKWDTLAKDQQLALAQTVAGVRQYTQLVALMDNWDVFQENLNTAYTAEGSLQEQADIYAESWEAAQKRVKASMQEIYSALIPEDFIINFTSATADVLDGVGDILRGMGGFKTILLMISSIALRQFGPSLGASLQNGINKIGQLNIASNGLSGVWKAMATPQFSNVDALAQKLTTIQKSSNDVNTQMNLYNKELEKGASSATKMA